MLYIFDLGNVIVDIDFNRALGVWSNLSGAPLAQLQHSFAFDAVFEKHERGEITDREFAEAVCKTLEINLSYEQFTVGWQAIFVGVRQDILARMQSLRDAGERVVILSNTNQLHCEVWPTHYPEVIQAADAVYLSHQLKMRKPDSQIYQAVLEKEGVSADHAVFFDDHPANVAAAEAAGITAVQVTGPETVAQWFSGRE